MEKEEQKEKKGERTVNDLKGVQDINTGVSKRIRSVPHRDDRYYLDLYLLQKEKERLEMERDGINKRRKRVRKRMDDVQQEMAEKQEKALEMLSVLHESPGRPSQAKDKEEEQSDKHKGKGWKRIALDY